jgi:hypothetical protein
MSHLFLLFLIPLIPAQQTDFISFPYVHPFQCVIILLAYFYLSPALTAAGNFFCRRPFDGMRITFAYFLFSARAFAQPAVDIFPINGF